MASYEEKLRDTIAIEAMKCAMNDMSRNGWDLSDVDTIDIVAKTSFALASEMMCQRSAPVEEECPEPAASVFTIVKGDKVVDEAN